jgi:hypothetical protein
MQGIYRFTILINPEVKMRAGSQTAASDITDHFTLADMGTRFKVFCISRQMGI